MDSRKSFCGVSGLNPVCCFPAECMRDFPSEEAMPMEIFLSAPPKPPMACPLKWERTRIES